MPLSCQDGDRRAGTTPSPASHPHLNRGGTRKSLYSRGLSGSFRIRWLMVVVRLVICRMRDAQAGCCDLAHRVIAAAALPRAQLSPGSAILLRRAPPAAEFSSTLPRAYGRSVSCRSRCAADFCRAGDVPRPAVPAVRRCSGSRHIPRGPRGPGGTPGAQPGGLVSNPCVPRAPVSGAPASSAPGPATENAHLPPFRGERGRRRSFSQACRSALSDVPGPEPSCRCQPSRVSDPGARSRRGSGRTAVMNNLHWTRVVILGSPAAPAARCSRSQVSPMQV